MKIANILSGVLSTTAIASIALVAHAQVLENEILEHEANYVEQHQCLALNIYHEARSQSRLGQKAVGFVTMNRVYHTSYPSTICDVVYQAHLDSRGNPLRNKCQFSWYCDGKNDDPNDEVKWTEAQNYAHEVMTDYGVKEDYTEGAIMYHASYVNPYWAGSYDKTVRIDTHIFYK